MIVSFVQPVQRAVQQDAGGDAHRLPGAGHRAAGQRLPALPVSPRHQSLLLSSPLGLHPRYRRQLVGGNDFSRPRAALIPILHFYTFIYKNCVAIQMYVKAITAVRSSCPACVRVER
jgi:hypothetical protein